jgi:hypothetical protein
MNAFKSTLFALAVASLLASATYAAAPSVGTAKARGDYRPGAWSAQRSSGFRSYAYRAPTYRRYSPATIQAAPAPAVAQAPSEVRRYSYAPQGATVTTNGATSSPCPATAAPVDPNRRFSYAPAPTAAASPAPSGARPYVPTYSGRAGYSRSPNRSTARNLWALPKTDPRKFNAR